MKELVITQENLRCLGGFLQVLKQNNISDFSDCRIVLSGKFNIWILKIFLEDARNISNYYNVKFACLKILDEEQLAAKDIFLEIDFAQEIILPENIKPPKFKREVSFFEKNPDALKRIMTRQPVPLEVVDYWKNWYKTALHSAAAAQYEIGEELDNCEALYLWFNKFDYFAGRLALFERECRKLVFIVDPDENLAPHLRYAFLNWCSGKIVFHYAPLYLYLELKKSELPYFACVLESLFSHINEHIDALQKMQIKMKEDFKKDNSMLNTQISVLNLYKKKIAELSAATKGRLVATVSDAATYFELKIKERGYSNESNFIVTTASAEKIYNYLEKTYLP